MQFGSSEITCHVTQHACWVKWYVQNNMFVAQNVENNGLVSLHVNWLTDQLFHRYAEIIFNISCYSNACWDTWHVISDEPNCMLSYMHVE